MGLTLSHFGIGGSFFTARGLSPNLTRAAAVTAGVSPPRLQKGLSPKSYLPSL